MKKKFEKDSMEWKFFQDYWKLCQDFWIVEKSDEYWDKLIVDINVLGEKYANMPFAIKLLLDFAKCKGDECLLQDGQVKGG